MNFNLLWPLFVSYCLLFLVSGFVSEFLLPEVSQIMWQMEFFWTSFEMHVQFSVQSYFCMELGLIFGTRHCFRIIFSGFSFFFVHHLFFFVTHKCVIMNHTQSSCFANRCPSYLWLFCFIWTFFLFMSILEKTERNKKMQMSQGWVKALVNMPLVVTFAFTANFKCFCTT